MRSWRGAAPNMTPADLARMAREQRKPTVEEGQARHAARHLRTWQDKRRGMLHVAVSSSLMSWARSSTPRSRSWCEAMRPPKGQPWDAVGAPRGGCAHGDVRRGRRRGADRDADGGGAGVAGDRGRDARSGRDRRHPVARRDGRAVAGVGVDRTGAGRRRRLPDGDRQTQEQLVTEDRPRGDAARRALPLRELRPPLRAPDPPPPAPELGWQRRDLEPGRGRAACIIRC